MISEAYWYICRSRERAVKSTEDEFENWKNAHAHAMAVRDLEDWGRECLRTSECTLAEHRSIVDKLRTNRLHADPQIVGEAVRGLFHASLSLIDAIQQTLASMEKNGFAVENAAALNNARDELQRAKKSFEGSWPWRNIAAWQTTEKQIAAGECQFAEDILHELQGGHPQGNQGPNRILGPTEKSSH